MLKKKLKPAKSQMWTLLLTLLFILMGSSTLFAQKRHESAFLLKNGEVVFGTVVRVDSLGRTFVENSCGIRMLNSEDIESVKDHRNAGFFEQKKKGYYNLSSLALMFGKGREDLVPVPSITMVNGYYFHPQLFTGIGIGYEYYDWSVMPVFIEAKYLLNRRRIIPFASLKIGMGISLEKADQTDGYYPYDKAKTYDGAMIAPELGLLFPTGRSEAFMVSVGYHHQQLSYDSYSWWYQDYTKRRVYTNFNRISLRVSYLFR